MSKGTTVTMFSRSNETLASNVGAKEAWGHKKRENLFINSFVGTSAGGVSYVNSKTRSTNDVQGKIINTGIVSDMAIDGDGLLVVSETTTGPAKFTRRGDFRQDELGFWKNGADQLLRAWKLDNDENLPQGASLLESLEAVNFANTKGSPVATTVVSIAMNLNADQEALRGGGPDAILNRSGLNTGKKIDDILFPEKLGSSSLSLGDEFNFTSSDGVLRTLEFGGMVLGRRPDNATNSTIFGATGPSAKFTFPPVPGPGQLAVGHQLRITVDGQQYLFSAVQGSPSVANKTFNTIQSLAAAIDRISSLKATVDSLGRLYIAPTKPNSAIQFANVGGGSIVEELGLTDLAQAAGGVVRFNSLGTLRDAVNADQDVYSLKATIEGKDLKITSLLSTSSLNVTASSLGINAITRATINPNASEVGRATCFISAPGHTLVAGDFVTITGLGNALVPNGVYSVGAINPNGFTIGLIHDGSIFPPANAAPALAPAAASWQKIPGQTSPTLAGNITAVAGNGGGPNNITITTGGAHNLVVNDVIYVEGGTYHTAGGDDIVLSAGYYRVKVQAAPNTFEITALDVVAGVAYPAAVGVSFHKVGTAVGGLPLPLTGTFNTNIFDTTNLSSIVNYHIGTNHTYKVDENITFTGIVPPLVINNITIANNVPYKITNVNLAAGTISFETQAAVGPVVVANATAFAPYAAPSLGLRVENGSQLMKYFSINPEKVTYDETYDPTNPDKNLSAAVNSLANFPSSQTYSVPITVYDSLGSSYTLLLYFAKLDNNKWAIELTSKKDKNGVFEVSNVLADTNGLIRQGIIEFETDGTLKGIPEGFEEAIDVQHNNGSASGSITIDWENALSEITSGTVSQTKNPNNVEIIQGDGQGAGTLTKLEISPEGYIIGTFSTGETRKLYKVPLAIFANVNGLVAGSNGTFDVSRESGELLLKEAGIGGAGRTLGGVLEASNVDTTEELLKVQELSNTIRANARVAAIDNENFKNILSELGR